MTSLDNPLPLLSILVGSIFIVTGVILYLYPPKKINSMYGYRSKKSMSNDDHWQFAQKYAAKMMVILGFMYFLITQLILIFDIGKSYHLSIGIGLLIALCICIFLMVEHKMKVTLDKKKPWWKSTYFRFYFSYHYLFSHKVTI